MPDRGFEVELVMALNGLIKGKLLDIHEYQIINCATEEEKSIAFKKVMCRLLYDYYNEASMDKINSFKLNLELIKKLQKGENVIINSTKDPKNISILNKSSFQEHHPADYDMVLESALNKLIIGKTLDCQDIMTIGVASDIDLIDAFGYVLNNTLSEMNESFGENSDLNMYILKSLKLTSVVYLEGLEIYAVSRDNYGTCQSKKLEKTFKNV